MVEGYANQGIMVVLAGAEADREADIGYLENILKAAQLTPMSEKVALVQLLPEGSLPLAALLSERQCHTALLFGLPPARAGIRAALSPYAPTRIGGLNLLWCHQLSEIRADRARGDNAKASALWQALKVMFL